ncbi:hypothetical protein F751_5525 [Auxenochlorella protothecoides]|uniref:Uncharacterized protein n=1 Tax=Auxenochlorella protothecoides TaxID=3075 RepID=A0A087SAR2_AUXPR|nr:hypothetical protein F751_5525 [Auxenochlorella protothecoides]KFM22816.1 hypothetical protein F751_5525 [Auxenochlorella protothecoides]
MHAGPRSIVTRTGPLDLPWQPLGLGVLAGYVLAIVISRRAAPRLQTHTALTPEDRGEAEGGPRARMLHRVRRANAHRVTDLETRLRASDQRAAALGEEAAQRAQQVADLQAALEAAKGRLAELEAALKAERREAAASKGLLRAERERTEILEKARAAAVRVRCRACDMAQDTSKVLGQLRDANFDLEDAQEEVETLSQRVVEVEQALHHAQTLHRLEVKSAADHAAQVMELRAELEESEAAQHEAELRLREALRVQEQLEEDTQLATQDAKSAIRQQVEAHECIRKLQHELQESRAAVEQAVAKAAAVETQLEEGVKTVAPKSTGRPRGRPRKTPAPKAPPASAQAPAAAGTPGFSSKESPGPENP